VPPARAEDAARRVLTAALEQARRRGRDDLVARLIAERDRLDRPECTVLVVGEFNKGKSSLVNALLNARVCATDADVATAVPTLVRHALEFGALARSGDAEADAVPVDPAAVTGLTTRGAAERRAGTERAAGAGPAGVEIGVPRELLHGGLVLVDTPGMGGGLNAAHGAITLRALAGADGVVFVTDASQELTAHELDLLRRAAELCPRVAVALTKIDFYPEWPRIRDLDLDHLARAGVRAAVLPLSAPLRHHAVREGDKALSADSGFPHLAAFLRDTATATRRAGAAGAAAAAHSALTQLAGEAATAQQALAEPDRREERLAQWTAAKQRAEQLRSAASRWQTTLADGIGRMVSDVDYDLTVRLRGVRRDVAERLATTAPGRGWVDLEPWIYQRTNEALADHLRLVRDEADRVADEVASGFGDAAWELWAQADTSGLGLRGTAAGEDTGLTALASTRASRVELGMMTARGGSVGVVAVHAVGLVLGLGAPVVLPLAAVLAGVIGKVALKGARTAQNRALRAEAERAVAGYLDEIEVRARRDSRDAVRRVQQHLREVFTEHAAELYTSTARNLELLQKSLREQEAQAQPQQLAKAAAETGALQDLATRAGRLVDVLLGETAPAPAAAAAAR
jgi:signal recognition particle receptor subunit beta